MKIVEKVDIEKFFCDECWKSMDSLYIHLEMIDDLGMRLLESKKTTITRHLTYWRKDIDLCSIDCWKKYLWKVTEDLLFEIIKS